MERAATGRALVEFWDWAAEKGLVKANTARNYKVASARVLGVLDDWTTTDLRVLDVEDVLVRFRNRTLREFSPASLGSYEARFRAALKSYLAYVEDPASWRFEGRKILKTEKPGPTAHVRTSAKLADRPSPVSAGLVDYPCPLKNGRFGYMRLPADLDSADVRRLTAFLNTLVFDEPT